MLRCVRGNCGVTATAGLGYDLRTCKAWVYDLEPDPDKSGTVASDGAMALCERHADMAHVPQGWEMVDQRALRAASMTQGAGAGPGVAEVSAAVGVAADSTTHGDSADAFTDETKSDASSMPTLSEVADSVTSSQLDTAELPIIKPDRSPTRLIESQPVQEPADDLDDVIGKPSIFGAMEDESEQPVQEPADRLSNLKDTPLLERAFRAVSETSSR